jgi:hypothetical protein
MAVFEKWDVLLPIIGLELREGDISFGPFSIKVQSALSLKAEHQLRIADSMWSTTVLSVEVYGKPVPAADVCDWCPRRGKHYTRPVQVNGEVMQVTAIAHKACICMTSGDENRRVDAVGLATPLLEDMLSLIRLFVYIANNGSYPAFNIISLQRLPHYSAIAALSEGGQAHSEDLVPGTRKYEVPLRQREVDAWISALGFGDLASTIYRSHMGDHVSELEEVLGASLIQFGSMLEEANLRDCFLRGATAVEAIANESPDPGGISSKFRDIGATLAALARHHDVLTQSTPQIGVEMKNAWIADRDRLKLIYQRRCHISHGSRRLNETDEDLLYSAQLFFAQIARGALLLFLEVSSKQQFYAKLTAARKALSP